MTEWEKPLPGLKKGLLAASEKRATQEKDVNRPYRKITPNEDRVQ